MELGPIDKLTKDFADSRSTLEGRVSELNDAIDALKRKYLPLIRYAVNTAVDRKAKLTAEIEKHPDLFVKPRTLILHGIKIGFQKERGGLTWEDDEQVVKLIKKHFPDQAETLVKTKETPVKQALSQLTVADLKKLGVAMTEGGDKVLVAPVDSDVDKLVNKLLDDEKQAA